MEHPASPERRRRVQRLFAETVGLDPDRRAARLERACGDDPRLREAVQALLDQHAGGDGAGPDSRLVSSKPGHGRMPTPEDDPLGEYVGGRHRLIEELGRGAMGVVYKAEDTKRDCFVTLKFLHAHLATDRQARKRFIEEAKAASGLNHRNICTFYDHDEAEDGRLYLVMAYYEGESLENVIERGPLPVDKAVDIARQIAAGLAAAHRPTPHHPDGIVHRDIKPSNVFITDEGEAIILDFGIAKVADSGLTRTGDILGTTEYMSPEHLRGQVGVGTDVWALGVTLYEMLAGTRPFQADFNAALQFAISNMEPAPLARADVPEELAEIVRRCLEKDLDLRYPSAEEVEVDLERLRLGEPAAHPSRRVSRRTRRLAFGLGALALLLVLLLSPLRTAATDWLGDGSDIQSIAVVPFMGSAAEASVGEGLAYELTHLLTGLGSRAEQPITVISASGMREIKTAQEAHERFNVDVAIIGDFRQDVEEAHLTLDLVDARTSHVLRTDRLSEPANRLPVLQQRALVALADMLDLPLSDEQRARFTAGTADAEAFEYYLRGKGLLGRFDREENVSAALDLFELALKEDADYALAHASLCEVQMRKYKSTKAEEWVERAEHHCSRALELDGSLAPVHVTLGDLHFLTGDHKAAAKEHLRAIAHDSTEAGAYRGLGEAYAALQRPVEAERDFRKAIQLQHTDWRYPNYFGTFLLDGGRIDEAIDQFQRSIDLAPDNDWSYSNMGVAYFYKGDFDQAVQWFEDAIGLNPTASNYNNLASFHHAVADFDEEAETYERALKQDSSSYTIWGNLGDAYSRLNRRSDATIAYERATELALAGLRVNPNDANLRTALAGYVASMGKTREALWHLARIPLDAQGDYFLPRRVGGLYAMLEQPDDALRWIEEAIHRGLTPNELEMDGNIIILRNDPRYHYIINTHPQPQSHE